MYKKWTNLNYRMFMLAKIIIWGSQDLCGMKILHMYHRNRIASLLCNIANDKVIVNDFGFIECTFCTSLRELKDDSGTDVPFTCLCTCKGMITVLGVFFFLFFFKEKILWSFWYNRANLEITIPLAREVWSGSPSNNHWDKVSHLWTVACEKNQAAKGQRCHGPKSNHLLGEIRVLGYCAHGFF